MDCCQQVSRACRNFSEHSRICRERERERELRFVVNNLGLHLVDIREDCLPVVFADNWRVVAEPGTVGKVSHQHVERLQVRGF